MSRPLVSVIIRTYNRAATIREAVKSALAQTLSDREILVVDDGSTDNTHALLAELPGIRYLRQANSGIVGARQTGLREARGKYVALLDSDDRWTPDYLERMIAPMETGGAGIALCDLVRIDPEGGRHPGFARLSKRLLPLFSQAEPQTLSPQELRALFIESMPAPSSAMVLLRDPCSCDWRFPVRVLDDWIMALEAILSASPSGVFIPQALVTKRIADDGVYESRTALHDFRTWFYHDRERALLHFGERLTPAERTLWRREIADLAFDAGHAAATAAAPLSALRWYAAAAKHGRFSSALWAALKIPASPFRQTRKKPGNVATGISNPPVR